MCSSREYPYLPHRRDSLEILIKLHTLRLIFWSYRICHPPFCGGNMDIFWTSAISLTGIVSIDLSTANLFLVAMLSVTFLFKSFSFDRVELDSGITKTVLLLTDIAPPPPVFWVKERSQKDKKPVGQATHHPPPPSHLCNTSRSGSATVSVGKLTLDVGDYWRCDLTLWRNDQLPCPSCDGNIPSCPPTLLRFFSSHGRHFKTSSTGDQNDDTPSGARGIKTVEVAVC